MRQRTTTDSIAALAALALLAATAPDAPATPPAGPAVPSPAETPAAKPGGDAQAPGGAATELAKLTDANLQALLDARAPLRHRLESEANLDSARGLDRIAYEKFRAVRSLLEEDRKVLEEMCRREPDIGRRMRLMHRIGVIDGERRMKSGIINLLSAAVRS